MRLGGNLKKRVFEAAKLVSGGNRVEIQIIDKETKKVVREQKQERATHRLVLKF